MSLAQSSDHDQCLRVSLCSMGLSFWRLRSTQGGRVWSHKGVRSTRNEIMPILFASKTTVDDDDRRFCGYIIGVISYCFFCLQRKVLFHSSLTLGYGHYRLSTPHVGRVVVAYLVALTYCQIYRLTVAPFISWRNWSSKLVPSNRGDGRMCGTLFVFSNTAVYPVVVWILITPSI